jgi:peptidyl-prolyl cis-trans isomerase A (cyclophilin A)
MQAAVRPHRPVITTCIAGAATIVLVAATLLPPRSVPVARQPQLEHAVSAPPVLVIDRASLTPKASDLGLCWAFRPDMLRATIDTSEGTLHCWLDVSAPIAVSNFVGLATGHRAWLDPRTGQIEQRPYYDGLTFHRVIPGFVIQGGDPLGNGIGGPGYEFADEIVSGAKFRPGDLAMANAGPNTNGSQFFITDGSTPWLDGHYTIFGHCEDRDVIHRIASVPAEGDRPRTPVTITHVGVEPCLATGR